MENSSVRIWGIAANGKPFSQNAAFRSLSRTGAWIEGVVRTIIQPGEVIGLQYEANRARVRVGFVDSRQEHNITLAVVLLRGQRCPWECLVDLTTAQLAPRIGVDIVAIGLNCKWNCGAAKEFRYGSRQPMPVAMVVTCKPWPPFVWEQQFTAAFCIDDQRVRCECTVRTSDPA